MDPSFERPLGNPATKRTFRLREVSEELAGILSKDSRHVLLLSPYARCGDARPGIAVRALCTFEAASYSPMFPRLDQARRTGTRVSRPHRRAVSAEPSAAKKEQAATLSGLVA